jgi:hypothetical protein
MDVTHYFQDNIGIWLECFVHVEKNLVLGSEYWTGFPLSEYFVEFSEGTERSSF